MNESELYKELGKLTKDRDKWEESIPYVSSLLAHESVKIQAKALWLLGEIGLAYPSSVLSAVPKIASFRDSHEALLRERAVNALGRIFGGIYDDRFLVKPTKTAKQMMPESDLNLPYEGAKEMLLVDDVENREFLRELVERMYDELPAPKVLCEFGRYLTFFGRHHKIE